MFTQFNALDDAILPLFPFLISDVRCASLKVKCRVFRPRN